MYNTFGNFDECMWENFQQPRKKMLPFETFDLCRLRFSVSFSFYGFQFFKSFDFFLLWCIVFYDKRKEGKYFRKKMRVERRRHSKWLFKVFVFSYFLFVDVVAATAVIVILLLLLLLWFTFFVCIVVLFACLFVCLFVWDMVILCRTSSQTITIVWL